MIYDLPPTHINTEREMSHLVFVMDGEDDTEGTEGH